MPIPSCAGSSAAPTGRCCRPRILLRRSGVWSSEREPFYQNADLTIWSRDVPHEKIVDECIDALHAQALRRQRDRTGIGYVGRHMMTAPLNRSDPITVDVALGDRSYDIVIGRDVLASLGARIAALRPGARTAIVTDRTVARHWLARTEAALADAGIADIAYHCR